MIPCPSCHQPVEILEKHLGTLFTCPHCNAVYFIDWSGQPEVAQHDAEAEPLENLSYEAPSEQNFAAPASDFVPPFEENPPVEENPVLQEYAGEATFTVEEPTSESETVIASPSDYMSPEPSVSESLEAEPEVPYDFSQTLDAVAEPAPSSTPDTPDFSDVTDFANANTASGPLSYTVIIEGIESSRLLAQLKEALTDSRFGLDVSGILQSVGGGRLVIPGMTPAKASVLINRIKYLPFKISWRQDVLSGS